MSREFIAVVTLLLPALAMFAVARDFRSIGQQILDTGFFPKHSFLHFFPPHDVDVARPRIWGHMLKLSGLMGYIMTSVMILQAVAVVLWELKRLHR